ncbi:AAA family ATPase [Streptomyces sp. HNM1019]|uniref:AAA family ATPase n=1 Tax=Streptomyces sp. HNM1019 TaxID=3424717 RepID=UPI003D7704AB
MTLADRKRDLSPIAGIINDTAKQGRILLIEGAVGSGKSTLLLELHQQSTRNDVLILSATCSHIERTHRFAAIRQLLQECASLPDSPEDILKRLDDATLSEMLSGGSGRAGGAAVQVDHDVHTLLETLARRRPVIIAIDDSHHIDAASAGCLLYAMRRLRATPVSLVATATTVAPHANTLFHVEMLRLTAARSISIGPLSEHGVYQVLAEEFGTDHASRARTEFMTACGGSPLLLRALVDDTAEALATRDEDIEFFAGEAFDRAVLGCLRRHPTDAARLASGIAVLGASSTPVALAQLLAVEPGVVATLIAVLTGAGLLADGRYRHPRAELAVLNALPARERADLHRRAARLLHDHGADPKSVARHLIAANPPRATWVVDVLQEAARRAFADDEIAFAKECLKLAIRACADHRRTAAAQAMLLEIEWRAAPSSAGLPEAKLTEAVRLGQLELDHALALARYLAWHGRNIEAADTLHAVSASAADAGTTANEAAELRIMQSWLASSHPPLTAYLTSAPEPTESDRERVLPDVELRLRVTTALSDLLASRGDPNAADLAKHVLQTYRLSDATIDAIESALLILIYSDQLGAAATQCDIALADAGHRQAPTWQAKLGALRGAIYLRQGNLVKAESCTREALNRLSPDSWGVGIGLPLSILVLANLATGNHAEAKRLLDQPVPDTLAQSRHGLDYRYASGEYHLVTSQPRKALDDFHVCAHLTAAWGLDLPTLVPWRSGAAQAWLQLGRDELARQLLEEQLARVDSDHLRVRGGTLRLLASTVDVTERREILAKSIKLQQDVGDRLGLAYALADISAAHGACGEPRRARMQARLAQHVAKECGAALASVEPDRLPPPDPSRAAGLTNAEKRIAILAASGNTNREIATRLFITASTVEQHLTRVFRKLKIRRREELPASLGLETDTAHDLLAEAGTVLSKW